MRRGRRAPSGAQRNFVMNNSQSSLCFFRLVWNVSHFLPELVGRGGGGAGRGRRGRGEVLQRRCSSGGDFSFQSHGLSLRGLQQDDKLTRAASYLQGEQRGGGAEGEGPRGRAEMGRIEGNVRALQHYFISIPQASGVTCLSCHCLTLRSLREFH